MCVLLCMREREGGNHTLQAGHMYLITSKTECTAASRAACSSGVGDRKSQKSTISATPTMVGSIKISYDVHTVKVPFKNLYHQLPITGTQCATNTHTFDKTKLNYTFSPSSIITRLY